MAFSNIYEINVDIKDRITSVVPTFKQGDTAVLKFRVYDNGQLFNITGITRAEVTFRSPTGKTYLGEAVIENGLIVYNFTGVEMSEEGKLETILTIYSGNSSVSCQPFVCFIFGNMKGDTLTYINLLQELIKEVQDLGLSVNEHIDKIEEFLSEAREEFEQLLLEVTNGLKSYDYNPSIEFNFPNLVLYNGSTYIALKKVKGVVPNDDKVNWRLVAQRGVDGTGSVSSVNGIMPDLDGNVDLGDIGGTGTATTNGNFELEEENGEVYITFPTLPFNVDVNGDIYYVGENGNAGVSFGDELYVWKVR